MTGLRSSLEIAALLFVRVPALAGCFWSSLVIAALLFVRVPALAGYFKRSRIVVALLSALLLAGCARDRSEMELALMGPSMAPRPPLFLTGPMSGLITNASSYSAQATLDYGGSSNRIELASGKLLGRGTMLLFVPESGEDMTKQAKEAGVSFIWNAANNSGFMLSEAMQGFAPMSLGVHITNLIAKPGSGTQERIEGYLCDRKDYEGLTSDGSRVSFIVWETRELAGLPLRVVQQGSGRPLELRLSKVRLEKLPDGLFSPPADFKQFATPESLMGEMAMRKQHLKLHR